MTDEPLSDCSNCACAKKKKWLADGHFPFSASDLLTQLGFLWSRKKEEEEKEGKKGKTLSYLQLAGLSGHILERTVQAPVLKPLKCSEGIQIKDGTGGEYVQFQLHVWASHYKKISPGPVWSTPQPSSPWKKKNTPLYTQYQMSKLTFLLQLQTEEKSSLNVPNSNKAQCTHSHPSKLERQLDCWDFSSRFLHIHLKKLTAGSTFSSWTLTLLFRGFWRKKGSSYECCCTLAVVKLLVFFLIRTDVSPWN